MFDNKRETLCQKKSVLHCSISQLQHNSNNGKVRPVIFLAFIYSHYDHRPFTNALWTSCANI